MNEERGQITQHPELATLVENAVRKSEQTEAEIKVYLQQGFDQISEFRDFPTLLCVSYKSPEELKARAYTRGVDAKGKPLTIMEIEAVMLKPWKPDSRPGVFLLRDGIYTFNDSIFANYHNAITGTDPNIWAQRDLPDWDLKIEIPENYIVYGNEAIKALERLCPPRKT